MPHAAYPPECTAVGLAAWAIGSASLSQQRCARGCSDRRALYWAGWQGVAEDAVGLPDQVPRSMEPRLSPALVVSCTRCQI